MTEVGWVADLVNQAIPVGNMLCTANPAQISAAYNDLLVADVTAFDTCVDRLGSKPRTAPDGTPIINPCRQIIEDEPDPVERRTARRSSKPKFTTNSSTRTTPPAGSWSAAARCSMRAETSAPIGRAAPPTHSAVGSTMGPLRLNIIDAAKVPSSTIPLIADGAVSDVLAMRIGEIAVSDSRDAAIHARPGAKNFARRSNRPRSPRASRAADRKAGGVVWEKKSLQDYRAFAPVHNEELQHPDVGRQRADCRTTKTATAC